MIFQASIQTRMNKVKVFFAENMTTAVDSLEKMEDKWRQCLQSAGNLPGHVHSSIDAVKKEMKKDAGFTMTVDSQIKTMEAMS